MTTISRTNKTHAYSRAELFILKYFGVLKPLRLTGEVSAIFRIKSQKITEGGYDEAYRYVLVS